MTDKQGIERNRLLRLAARADRDSAFAERRGESEDARRYRELSRDYRIAAARVESEA